MLNQLSGYHFLSALFLLTVKGKLKVSYLRVWLQARTLVSGVALVCTCWDCHARKACSRFRLVCAKSPVFPPGDNEAVNFFPSGLCRQSDCRHAVLWRVYSSAVLQRSPSAVQSQLDLLWGANWLAGSGLSFIDYSPAVGKHQPCSCCSPEACQFLS